MSDIPRPTARQLEALRRIKKMASGLESVIVNRADADACVNHDWALKRGGGRYALTVEGRAFLRDLA